MHFFDNSRQHSVRIIKEKTLDLCCSVLLHPPYSSDLAPSDFYLFHYLQIDLNENTFSPEDQLRTYKENFLSSNYLAQLAGAVEYTDCTSAEEYPPPMIDLYMTLNNLMVRFQ